MTAVQEPKNRHRKGDHETSKAAAVAVAWGALTQQTKLLYVWGQSPEGLTDEEAAAAAEISPFSNFWKRAGELRERGLIRWHPKGETRKGESGMARKVSVITELGRRELGLKGWG
jgi:hypothetical protein